MEPVNAFSIEKPAGSSKYFEWLAKYRNVVITDKMREHYERIVPKMEYQFKNSPFWTQWLGSLREFDAAYKEEKGYPLLANLDTPPDLKTKPWLSFLDKTYRKNVIANPNWPYAPPDGWILPDNWYSQIKDIIRTSIVVKYLDGADFLIKKTNLLCKAHGKEDIRCDFEAKEEGYYAVHMYIMEEFEIPRIDWDTEKITTTVEIQITTQIQEVIRDLLRKYYEDKRSKILPTSGLIWQWDYKSPEFTTYYLGHILHYIEGMIMTAREKERSHGTVY